MKSIIKICDRSWFIHFVFEVILVNMLTSIFIIDKHKITKATVLGFQLCKNVFNFLNISLFVRAQQGHFLSIPCRINFGLSWPEECEGEGGVPWKSDREKRQEFVIGQGFEEENTSCKLALVSTRSSYILSTSYGREWRWWFGVLKNLIIDLMIEVRWTWNCGIHAIRSMIFLMRRLWCPLWSYCNVISCSIVFARWYKL